VVPVIFRQVRIKFIEVDDYTVAAVPEYSEVAETPADTLLLNQAQLTPPWRTTFSQIQSPRHKINTPIYQLIKFASKSSSNPTMNKYWKNIFQKTTGVVCFGGNN